jgi:hypothetical protein
MLNESKAFAEEDRMNTKKVEQHNDLMNYCLSLQESMEANDAFETTFEVCIVCVGVCVCVLVSVAFDCSLFVFFLYCGDGRLVHSFSLYSLLCSAF